MHSPSRPLKIAFVVHDYHEFGGHARYVVELAQRLSAHHFVTVFANRIDADGSERVHFHRVPALRSSALSSILSFAVAARALPLAGYDIVHSQGFTGAAANITTAHFCWPAVARARDKAAASRPFRMRLQQCIITPLERAHFRSRRLRSVIAVSESLARDLQVHYRPKAPVEIVYHGVNTKFFLSESRERTRAALQVPTSAYAFLFVGDLAKGADRVLLAMREIPNTLLLIGSASSTDKLHGLAGVLGMRDRLRIFPAGVDVVPLYAAADAMAFPTPYEAFGLVILEAMAAGLPVITTRGAGVAELLTDHENALLLEDAGSQVELERRMRLLADNKVLGKRLGNSARTLAAAYTWERTVSRTEELYSQIVTPSLRSVRQVVT